jgi:hypothetical protein
MSDSRSGMGVDLVLAGPGPEELFFERAEDRVIEGVRIRVASAEDVVTMKLLAGRPKDVDANRRSRATTFCPSSNERSRARAEVRRPQSSPRCLIAFPPRYFATVASGTAYFAIVARASSSVPVSWFG